MIPSTKKVMNRLLHCWIEGNFFALHIVAVAAARDAIDVGRQIAAGGLSTKTEITLPARSQVVVPVLLIVILLKKVSVVKKVVTVGIVR